MQKRLEVQKRLPVLSFDRVTGSKMPVVTNLFASRAHLALALEVSPDEVVARFAEAQKNGLPTKTVSTGPVKDIVLQGDEATLSKLPLITHCEKDAGPYLTSGVTVMRDPETGKLNAGIYRNLRTSPTSLTMNMAPLCHGAEILSRAEAEGQHVQAAIIAVSYTHLTLPTKA